MVAIKLIALTFLAAALAAPEAVPDASPDASPEALPEAAPEALPDAMPEAAENAIIRPCPKGKVRCCPGNPACYPPSLCRIMLCPIFPGPINCCCDGTCPKNPKCATVRCRKPYRRGEEE